MDNGIGIPHDETRRLFKIYSTLRNARDINAAGAGLGLYICKSLCKQLKGKITFMSPESQCKTVFIAEINAKIGHIDETDLDEV